MTAAGQKSYGNTIEAMLAHRSSSATVRISMPLVATVLLVVGATSAAQADVDPGGGLRFANGNTVSGYFSLAEPLTRSAAVDTLLQQSVGIGIGGTSGSIGFARALRDAHFVKVALDFELFRSWWKSSWPTATYLGPQVRIHVVVFGGFCGLLWAWLTTDRLMTCGFTLGLD